MMFKLNTLRREFFYLISLFLLASCNKEEVAPVRVAPVKPGILENFIKADPTITLQKTTQSAYHFENAATYRGYVFKPLSNIRITAIGGKIAEKGNYKIEIFSSESGNWKSDTLLVENIQITDTQKFQYKELGKGLELAAHKSYIIRYFNESHNSVYDAVLPRTYQSATNPFSPIKIGDIEVEKQYYTYHYKNNGEYYVVSEGVFSNSLFRGLVDFKYDLME